MAFGKEVTLFLIDGDHGKRMACELANWTGKAYRIPRRLLRETDRPDLHKAGMYLLFGRKHPFEKIDIAYVGEGAVVFESLKQHAKEDSWEELLVFVSKDDNLTRAHVRFLKYRAWTQATEAGRYQIKNKKAPSRPALSESEEAVMSEFFDNLTLLTGTLGYEVFEPIFGVGRSPSERYFLWGPRGAKAEAEVAEDDDFIVKKDSRAAGVSGHSTPDSVLKLRDEIEREGVVVKDGACLIFQRDHRFSSASAAASVVLARIANGLAEWKDADGRILGESLYPQNSVTGCKQKGRQC